MDRRYPKNEIQYESILSCKRSIMTVTEIDKNVCNVSVKSYDSITPKSDVESILILRMSSLSTCLIIDSIVFEK